ncbi:MAG: hypothetical protein ACK5LL_07935 [Suipraeoptans sp.]
MLIEKIVMSLFFAPFAWILYAIMRSHAKEIGGVLLGVSVTPELLLEERIHTIITQYKRRLLIFAALTFSSFTVVLMMQNELSLVACGIVWMMVTAIVMQIPYIASHNMVVRIKASTIEELHMKFGLFYYNKRDKKTLIPSRIGVGVGVNFAKPAGKIIAIFAVLIFAGSIALLAYALMI